MARGIVFSSALIVGLGWLSLPHAHVTTNTDTASLVGHSFAKLSALHQAGELLGAEDNEWLGLDLHPPVHAGWQVAIGRLQVKILLFLGGLKQAECQLVQAFVSNRQVGEDEVTGFGGSVKVGHARGRNTREDGRVVGGGILNAAMGKRASMFQAGVQEEIGVVVKGDVLALGNARAFNDA
jgi:hypothetical protein